MPNVKSDVGNERSLTSDQILNPWDWLYWSVSASHDCIYEVENTLFVELQTTLLQYILFHMELKFLSWFVKHYFSSFRCLQIQRNAYIVNFCCNWSNPICRATILTSNWKECLPFVLFWQKIMYLVLNDTPFPILYMYIH